MKLTERLYQNVEDIWDGYYTHPFIKEMGSGKLAIEKFRFYMIQDYLYLLDYAKVFALGVVKADDEDTMRKFAGLVNSILNDEMNIHKTYLSRLSITNEELKTHRQSLANTSYTNYMLAVAYNGTILELLGAILACSWSYQKIGEYLNKIPSAADHVFFGEWILGYASEEYQKSNDETIELMDELGKEATEKEIENLIRIFRTCSLYEAKFWDMAYGMEG